MEEHDELISAIDKAFFEMVSDWTNDQLKMALRNSILSVGNAIMKTGLTKGEAIAIFGPEIFHAVANVISAGYIDLGIDKLEKL